MGTAYVTTPIYYVNDVPHLGNAYATMLADTLARYFRLSGRDTYSLVGTDEHGLKLERAAKEKGMTPEAFVNEASARFRDAWPHLNVANDDFIRTTEERHVRYVQELWAKVERNGHLYLGEYEDWYCVGCESFKTEKELLEGQICPDHRKPVEKLKEKTFFFALDRFQDALLALYARHKNDPRYAGLPFVAPESRLNEVLSFVRGELRPLSCSRTSFRWGIPVPPGPGPEERKDHIMYVWFDALTNYRSALGQGDLVRYWPTGAMENGSVRERLVHLVGKDILRFHAVYWPAFLLAAEFSEKDLPSALARSDVFDRLPTQIFATGFLTVNGLKMSKSLRNAVDPIQLGKEIGADAVRYYLLRAISFGQDGDFSHSDLIDRTNSELGKNLGNLLNRVLGLCAKNVENRVPSTYQETPLETAFFEDGRVRLSSIRAHYEALAPHFALEETMALSSRANQYVDHAAPWSAAKIGDRPRLETILRTLLLVLEALSVALAPVLPERTQEMRKQLGLPPLRTANRAEVPGSPETMSLWPSFSAPASDGSHPTSLLKPGAPLSAGVPLFPTIDDEKKSALLERLVPKLSEEGDAEKPAPAKKETTPSGAESGVPLPPIDYAAFSAVDLRAGLVVSAERVPKKDKLLKLLVNVGEASPRTIVAGLALTFSPEALVGKRVIVVANLAPREFGKGLVSHGMLLATGPSDALSLATVDSSVEPGAKLK